jgi:hypothetical protein
MLDFAIMLVHNPGVSSEMDQAGSPLSRKRLRQAYPEFTAGGPWHYTLFMFDFKNYVTKLCHNANTALFVTALTYM